MALTDEQIRRYARHVLLAEVGGKGQMRLLEAVVQVGDAGGARGAALLYLAAAGVGTLVVTDVGQVSPTDHYLYERADHGRSRLSAARERVMALNPDVRVLSDEETDGTSARAGWRLGLDDPRSLDPISQLEEGARAAYRVIRDIVRGSAV